MKQPTVPTTQNQIQPPAVSSLASLSFPFPPYVTPHLPEGNITASRRHYNTGTALFLTRVRLWEQIGGEHPYSYSMSNPNIYTDPSGNAPNRQNNPNSNLKCLRPLKKRKDVHPDKNGCDTGIREVGRECCGEVGNDLMTMLTQRIEAKYQCSPRRSDIGIAFVRNDIASALYCIASSEANCDPSMRGRAVDGIGYGVFTLGQNEFTECGSDVPNCRLAVQVSCAVQILGRNPGTNMLEKLGAYWAGLTKGEASSTLKNCMIQRLGPLWKRRLKNIPADPCKCVNPENMH